MTPLPKGFVDMCREHPALAGLPLALDTYPSVSVRLNPRKPFLDAPATFPASCPVPWCADGLYLPERLPFTFDPALHQGRYYVQDASSMAAAAAAAHFAGGADVRYLDMCAAPGGKTLGALSALTPGSLVVANEYDFKRAAVLLENVAKWGCPNVVVTRGDTRRFAKLPGFFDIVAVDAPCSGEGMMRKDDKARLQWSPALVEQCAALQRDILANAWQTLRPGGTLIYSTCTFNTAENEDNVLWLVQEYGAEPLPVTPLESMPGVGPGLRGDALCYRFIPGSVRGEGLFLAALRKPGQAAAARVKPLKPGKPVAPACSRWVSGDVRLVSAGDEIHAVPAPQHDAIDCLTSKLDTQCTGVHIATIKGRDIVPAHPLAISTILDPDAFPKVDVTRDEALAYLRCEAVELPDGTPTGHVLLSYDGYPLGFVKNLGRRSNNLYPKHWRILSQQPLQRGQDTL